MSPACAWAESQSQYILDNGVPLSDKELTVARSVGVRSPEAIRILYLDRVLRPTDPMLAEAVEQLHFLEPNTHGLTLGHGIFIRSDLIGDVQLAHECRHVYQYEQHGSIRTYLEAYIPDLLMYDYWNSPLEVDARNAAARYLRNGLRLA